MPQPRQLFDAVHIEGDSRRAARSPDPAAAIGGRLATARSALQRLERRLGDLSGELELMVKSELMGRLTHFETQIDEKLAQLSDRLHAIETASHCARGSNHALALLQCVKNVGFVHLAAGNSASVSVDAPTKRRQRREGGRAEQDGSVQVARRAGVISARAQPIRAGSIQKARRRATEPSRSARPPLICRLRRHLLPQAGKGARRLGILFPPRGRRARRHRAVPTKR